MRYCRQATEHRRYHNSEKITSPLRPKRASPASAANALLSAAIRDGATR